MRETFEMKNPEVGARVRVRTWGGEVVVGTVDAVYDDVKNDTPGFDYTTDDGATWWAYADQYEGGAR